VKNVKIGIQTISNYLAYLTESFLLNKAIRYDIKGKKYINTLSKYYFSDIGLRNAILDMRQQEETHIMENIIYNELIVRGYRVDVGMVEIRKPDKDGRWIRTQLEVDFVANLGSKKYYVQSALSIPDREKEMQESRPLTSIKDSFKKVIIVKDHIMPRRNEEGILTIGLLDFLLKEDSLDL
jgi:predicted AAA+ superfamily ATPase